MPTSAVDVPCRCAWLGNGFYWLKLSRLVRDGLIWTSCGKGYAGYAAGSPEYAAYMQQMTAGCGGAGGAAGAGAGAMGTPGAMGAPGAGAPGAPGIATDPLAAYYGAAGYAAQSLHYGTVKTFLAEKGFGFIECATSENGGDVFFSKSELPLDLESDSHKDLKGKPVQFEITVGK
ncbi:unnamed protein product, partial [Effrenium voratum]